MKNICFHFQMDENNVIVSTGYSFNCIPTGNYYMSREMFNNSILGKKVTELPEHDIDGSITKDAIIE